MSHTHLESGWRAIRRGPTRRALREASLVLTAVNIEHEVFEDAFDWYLAVPQQRAPEAVAQLERYRLENHSPLSVPQLEEVDSGWVGVVGFLLVIWMLPTLEGNGFLGWDWRALGHLDPGAVRNGEWWRAVTALTLHADLGHLFGNSVFGAVFGLMVGRYLGSGLGWLLILLGGTVGNLLNAAVRPEALFSIGASTATFAAVAIGSGFVWRRGYFRGGNWKRAFAPIFGGIAMLAFTGIGDDNTDIVAHFTGFGAGLVLGIAAARVNLRWLGRIGQKVCGAAAVALLLLAWMLAGGAAYG
ncbi:MAG: rhomboid family intramembrane serine protease [Pseudomonadota bacterium]